MKMIALFHIYSIFDKFQDHYFKAILIFQQTVIQLLRAKKLKHHQNELFNKMNFFRLEVYRRKKVTQLNSFQNSKKFILKLCHHKIVSFLG